jgi:nitroimidazol reductase NimA-like FMN-containing flavoprotein (pyridoxamine 5'-phosphate oxidase superfamily)
MDTYPTTPRTRVRRVPKRAVYDREAIHAILDEALICHVGFVVDGEPRVLPTAIARIGESVYLHGNHKSQMLRALENGAQACITVTHLDGLVVARSGMHSSMNYRSVVIFANGTRLEGERKRQVLETFVERLIPGRAKDLEVRPITDQELDITSVLEFPLEEVSAKVRSGGPVDDEADYALDLWAGVLPLGIQVGEPEADPRLKPSIPVPGYVSNYRRPSSAE